MFRILFPSYPTYQVFLAAGLAAFLTIVLVPLMWKFFKQREIGQIIRTDGPSSHLEKEGTPTMGGIVIILSAVISFMVFAYQRGYTWLSYTALFSMVYFGIVGLVDDYLKVIKVRSLGLLARYKVTLQLIGALIFGYFFLNQDKLPTSLLLPFTKITLNLPPVIYLIFLMILFLSTVNSLNLTDGLDGLAAGTASVVCFVFAAIAFRQGKFDLAVFGAAISGACIGFLWYNVYPADIFMGDTGSLALGGAVAALAALTKTELFLIIIGGIYVLETLSVIIQVLSFRWYGKRVFKMAPLHHHFELVGWSETKVMARFLILTAVLAGWGFIIYFMTAVKK